MEEVYKIGGIGTVACGRIETGFLKAGLRLKLFPSQKETEAKYIETVHMSDLPFEQKREFWASNANGVKPGQLVGVNIKGVATWEINRQRGPGILYRADESPMEDTALFTAQIVVMRTPVKAKITVGQVYPVQCCFAQTPCRI